jgi:hypothetical protein
MEALAMDGVFLFEGFRLDQQARTLFWRDEAGVFVRMAIGSRARRSRRAGWSSTATRVEG